MDYGALVREARGKGGIAKDDQRLQELQRHANNVDAAKEALEQLTTEGLIHQGSTRKLI